jgi:hypothetical protein
LIAIDPVKVVCEVSAEGRGKSTEGKEKVISKSEWFSREAWVTEGNTHRTRVALSGPLGATFWSEIRSKFAIQKGRVRVCFNQVLVSQRPSCCDEKASQPSFPSAPHSPPESRATTGDGYRWSQGTRHPSHQAHTNARDRHPAGMSSEFPDDDVDTAPEPPAPSRRSLLERLLMRMFSRA